MPDFDFLSRLQIYLPGEPLKMVPNRAGLYLLFDEARRVRRMAMTRDLRARARYYLFDREGVDGLSVARREAAAMGWLESHSRFESQLAHLHLYRGTFPEAMQPLYRLTRPHLLRVTMGEAYPRLLPVRRADTAGHVHIGPYVTREMAERDAAFVNDLLSLRRCDYEIVRFQPYERCLYLQMGTCVAPCDTFAQPPYHALAAQAVALLGGESAQTRAEIVAARDRAAEALDFEGAVRERDRVRALEKWTANRPAFVRPLERLNVVIPQRTAMGLDLFLFRAGVLDAWQRVESVEEGALRVLLGRWLAESRPPHAWRPHADHFALLSRWLWDREDNRHVLVDDPEEAAAAVVALAARLEQEEIEEEQGSEVVPGGEEVNDPQESERP